MFFDDSLGRNPIRTRSGKAFLERENSNNSTMSSGSSEENAVTNGNIEAGDAPVMDVCGNIALPSEVKDHRYESRRQGFEESWA